MAYTWQLKILVTALINNTIAQVQYIELYKHDFEDKIAKFHDSIDSQFPEGT